jgi:hypothetical protein
MFPLNSIIMFYICVIRIRSSIYKKKLGLQQKYSQREASVEEQSSQQLTFEARGHLKTALTQDIGGSEQTLKNNCNTDYWGRQ